MMMMKLTTKTQPPISDQHRKKAYKHAVVATHIYGTTQSPAKTAEEYAVYFQYAALHSSIEQ